MKLDTRISTDTPCGHCSYNLRGLTLDHACPECGNRALTSVHYVVNTRDNVALRARLVDVAETTGESVDALEFTFEVLTTTTQTARDLNNGAARHVGAADVCQMAAQYAKYHFGGKRNAVLALEAMGIESSADLGRLVSRLVDAGLFTASPEDRIEDFNGLFAVGTLYDARP